MMLVCDTREKYIEDYMSIFEAEGVNACQKQITAGDFALIDGDNYDMPLAIFERKTLNDYGASIKDGRHGNKSKMLDVAAKTGCKVFYIVEGAYNLTHKYAGIPYTTIESAGFHMMMEYGIMTIQTRTIDDTIETLIRFVRSMERLKKSRGIATTQDSVVEGGDDAENSSEIKPRPSIQIPTFALKSTAAPSVPAVLTEPRHPPSNEVLIKMWSSIKGIGPATAKVLAKHITFRRVIDETDHVRLRDNINNVIKTATGRAKRDAACKLAELAENIQKARTQPAEDIECIVETLSPVLEQITGISRATAITVVEKTRGNINNDTVAALVADKIINKSVASSILGMLEATLDSA